MFCAKCGNPMPKDAKFCGSCGNKMGQSVSPESPAIQPDKYREEPEQIPGKIFSEPAPKNRHSIIKFFLWGAITVIILLNWSDVLSILSDIPDLLLIVLILFIIFYPAKKLRNKILRYLR